MIELPEGVTLARQLNETVRGRTVEWAVAGQSPHGFAFYSQDASTYGDVLEDRRLGEARPLGSIVEIPLGEDLSLAINDGIAMRYLAPGKPEPPKHQLYIALDDGSALVCTVRMYGGMILFDPATYDSPYYLVALEKPSPLSEGFDEAYFEDLLARSKPKLSAKAFLATEQRIPGLGNGVLQDILFAARIHPKKPIGELSSEQTEALFHSVKTLLQAMTDQGGRDVEKDLFGKAGGYPTQLSSKTYKQPCPVCGGEILRQAYMGGNVYFCPTCQPQG